MNSMKIGDLEIAVPIIQGGMGVGISLSGLASAVANMGGIGVIASVGIGFIHKKADTSYKKSSIDAIRDTIRRAREQTRGVIGVNIMSVITNFSDMVKTSIEEGIDIIFSGAGLPLDLPKYLEKGTKTKLVPIISSARAAAIICNKWKQNFDYLPDALVVEGPKAGGHLGFKTSQLEEDSYKLEQLVPDVLEVTREIKKRYNKDIPVIAAGGIYSGSDIYEFIRQGATGVQLGTRFVATQECDASPEFKNAFISARAEDIKVIKSPVGMPGRTIFNQFLREAEEGKRKPKGCRYNCIRSCNPKTTTYCIADALVEAYRGNLENGFVFSGTNAGLVQEISTVSHVFDALREEYQQAEKDHTASLSSDVS